MRNESRRKSCRNCVPDSRFELLPLENVMKLQIDSDQIFSLKVFAAAYTIAMQEFRVEDSSALLKSCSQEIARGHMIEIR